MTEEDIHDKNYEINMKNLYFIYNFAQEHGNRFEDCENMNIIAYMDYMGYKIEMDREIKEYQYENEDEEVD